MIHKHLLVVLFLFGGKKFGECNNNLGFEASKVELLSDSGKLKSSEYELTQQISVLQYKFKKGCKCSEVKYDGNSVWNNSGSSYPDGVFFKTGGEVVVAMNDEWYGYTLNGGSWNLEKKNPMNTVELDINSKQSTEKYLYTVNEEGELYLSHANNFFNVVKDGKETLYEQDNSVEYARKVKINGLPNSKKLELELLSGVVMVYKKENNDSWKCISGCYKKSSLRGLLKPKMELNKTMLILVVVGVVLVLLVVVLVFLCKK